MNCEKKRVKKTDCSCDGPYKYTRSKRKLEEENKENVYANKHKIETKCHEGKPLQEIDENKKTTTDKPTLGAGSSKKTECTHSVFGDVKKQISFPLQQNRRIGRTEFNINPFLPTANIINDGIPSQRKKSVTRHYIKPSGHHGIINMEPNKGKVPENILYPDWLDDIMLQAYIKEERYVLPLDFARQNRNIVRARNMLVNWLTKLQHHMSNVMTSSRFVFDEGVFFITVKMLDRILNIVNIKPEDIQIVGIACYWIAVKMSNNVPPPKCKELTKLCRYEIRMTEILQAEKDVLQILKYDLNRDDPTIWINYFIYNMKIENCEIISVCSSYLLSCYMLDENSGVHRQSVLAAAAVSVAMDLFHLDEQYWDRLKNLPGYYDREDLINLKLDVLKMRNLVQDVSYEFRNAYFQYGNKKHGCVSTLLRQK